MECEYCQSENSAEARVCINCGKEIKSARNTDAWHSLHDLLWGDKINQDIVETLNDLNQKNSHFVDYARKLNRIRNKN